MEKDLNKVNMESCFQFKNKICNNSVKVNKLNPQRTRSKYAELKETTRHKCTHYIFYLTDVVLQETFTRTYKSKASVGLKDLFK